jgi:hypothetical protein
MKTDTTAGIGRYRTIIAALALFLAACAAAPYLIPAGMEFARNLLVTATNNYGSRHSEDISRLITRLSQPYVNIGAPPATPQYPLVSAPYPGQAGSTQTAYPGQAQTPYPGQPQTPYPQAPYPDPMQAQSPYPAQPQAPYPAPYPTQAQPPYPAQPQAAYPTPYPTQVQTPYPTQAQTQYPTQPQGPYPAQPQSPYPAQPSAYPAGVPSGGYPQYGGAPVQAPYPGQPPQYGAQYPQYPSTGVIPRSIPQEPVAVDVALVRQQAAAQGRQVVLMNDGDVLRGNPADPQAGDKFKLVVRTNCDCYLYIVEIDGSGWAQGVFPTKSSRYPNPVRKDEEYVFPEGANWYALDDVPGVETFYIVVSPNRRPDVEESILRVAGNERPKGRGVERVTSAAVIPNGFARKDAGHAIVVRSESGQQARVTPSTYVAKAPGEDVTVTRWFKHE